MNSLDVRKLICIMRWLRPRYFAFESDPDTFESDFEQWNSSVRDWT